MKRYHRLSYDTTYERIAKGKDGELDEYAVKTSDVVTPLSWLVNIQADGQGYFDTRSIEYLDLMWAGCKKAFADLFEIDFRDSYFRNLKGVYIIWHESIDTQVIRVGQGVIRTRLGAHRKEHYIRKFKEQGVFATWAVVPKEFRDGVEKFLSLALLPESGDRFPKTRPIEVSLPRWNKPVRTRLRQYCDSDVAYTTKAKRSQ